MKKYLRLVFIDLVKDLEVDGEKLISSVVSDFNDKPSGDSTAIIDVKKFNDFKFGNRYRNLQLKPNVSIVFIFRENEDMINSYTDTSVTQEDKADLSPELLVDLIREDLTLGGMVAECIPNGIEHKVLRDEKLDNLYMSKIDLIVKSRWVSPKEE